MSAILGLNFFHADTAACIVVDGKLKAALAEERRGQRLKHDPSFPRNAIQYVLEEAGLRFKDITHVAVAGDPKSNYRAKMGFVMRQPLRSAGAVLEHFRRRRKAEDVLDRLAEICDSDPADARFEVVRVEHHLAHIASTYYLSPTTELTAGFSFDASGDFVSAMAARCEGNRIEILDRVYLPHSLGFFYTAICQFIGFDQFGEEYKVMGLSGFGEDAYLDLMRKLVTCSDSQWFRLNTPYFGMHEGRHCGLDKAQRIIVGRLYTDRLVRELGPPRDSSQPITQREKDLAKSCQTRFEEVFIHCAQRLHRLVPSPRIAYAGGCALNGVANARLLRDTPFTTPFLQCAASDDGTCVGAAYYCYHNVAGGTERFEMEHPYWGPEYPKSRHRRAAEACCLPMRHYGGNGALVGAVADLLRAGLVVGWYQGRSEWGPRALGNRSILADPTRPDMKDLINAKIKRREAFRPFAPTVLREHVSTYFEQDILSPFMMHVVKIRPEWQTKLPAVTHVDGSGRLQSIERRHNPLYYDLIESFSKRSGVAAVLNTSFNENEPIVDTPEQAADCFTRTGLDALCLGNYVVCKPEHAALLKT